ncbi:AAA family ATPase [Kibdelosporangium aridum]|uniref:Uridine kinase n=1 Tax=Kibdelosporangium aridum TaxID=2030 RepID=A0A1W2FPF9_KIBAR|nr:AAA family ATPase [Kibdelosporangium aridum]SMD23488.1 uridine kinase [Kibdelosporangium aridum]
MPVLDRIIQRITAPGITRVAIDGPDAAGKTTMASELAARLDRNVVRVSVDDFHNPPEIRRRQGSLSPKGYYEDTFDYDAFRAHLLEPRSPGTVLIVDGVFLLRPELRSYWDLSIYLDVRPEETLRRALIRDGGLFGDAVRERYTLRYLPGQAHYRALADPLSHADIVIDNNDPESPKLVASR